MKRFANEKMRNFPNGKLKNFPKFPQILKTSLDRRSRRSRLFPGLKKTPRVKLRCFPTFQGPKQRLKRRLFGLWKPPVRRSSRRAVRLLGDLALYTWCSPHYSQLQLPAAGSHQPWRPSGLTNSTSATKRSMSELEFSCLLLLTHNTTENIV